MRRKPCPHLSWWVDRLPAPTGEPHWHIRERWSSAAAPDDTTTVELVASTAGVAWRVLTGRAGQLMCDDWSLDTGRGRLDEVLLRRHGTHVLLRTWECERSECAEDRR